MFMYPGTAPEFDKNLGPRYDFSAEPRRKYRLAIRKSLDKQLSFLSHVRDAHSGSGSWLDQESIPKNQWEIVYQPESGRKSYFSIGYAIGTLISDMSNNKLKGKDIHPTDKILFKIKTILEYFEHIDGRRAKLEAQQVKKELKSKASLSQLSLTSQTSLSSPVIASSPHSPIDALSDFNFDSTTSTGIINILEKTRTASTTMTTTTSSSTSKAVQMSRLSPLSMDASSITPPTSPSSACSRTPLAQKRMTPPTPPMSSANSMISNPGSSVGLGLDVPGNSAGLWTLGKAPGVPYGAGLMPVWSEDSTDSTILTTTTNKSSFSRLLKFGRKKKNNNNNLAGDSNASIRTTTTSGGLSTLSTRSSSSNNNRKDKQPSLPKKFGTRSPAGQYIQSLKLPDEQKLCFVPDAYQAILTLMDLVYEIYDQILTSLKTEKFTINILELSLIDEYLTAIEAPLTNLLISDAVRSIDAFVMKSALRTKEQIKADIENLSKKK